jgi:hypothetical protein
VQQSPSPLLVAMDYGRVVLVPRVASAEPADELARQRLAAQWLWSMRPPAAPDGTEPQMTNVQRVTQLAPQRQVALVPQPVTQSVSSVVHEHQSTRLTAELRNVLKPIGVKLVPFSLVAALLGGLVLAIGPGEWFILGRLRRRSWTWITWPAMTLAVTGVLIGVANAYLRSNDIPTVLTIHDLDAEGRIVRTNRLELLFKSTSGRHQTEVRRGIWSDQLAATNTIFAEQPMSGMGLRSRSGMTGSMQLRHDNPRTSVPTVTGRLPGPYTVEQTIEQWMPDLSRLLHVPHEPEDGPIDWRQVDLASWLKPEAQAHAVPDHVVRQVREQLGRKCLVALHHADGHWCVSDDRAWWISDEAYRMVRKSLGQPHPALRAQMMHRWAQLVWLLTHRRQSTGSWTLWGPPLGQPHLADVPILDPLGPHEWAITVIVRERQQTTVYRRLLGPRVATADPPPQPAETPP